MFRMGRTQHRGLARNAHQGCTSRDVGSRAWAAALVLLFPAGVAAQEPAPRPPRPPQSVRATVRVCSECDSAAVLARKDVERAAQEFNASLTAYQAMISRLGDDSTQALSRPELARAMRALVESQERLRFVMARLMQAETQSRLQVMEASRQPAISVVPGAAGWVGVEFTSRARNVQTERGVAWQFESYPVVASVAPGSPAARGGIAAGDVLIAIDHHDLQQGVTPFPELLRPGRTLSILVRRDGQMRELHVVVGRQPPPPALRDSVLYMAPEPGATRAWSRTLVTSPSEMPSVIMVPRPAPTAPGAPPAALSYVYTFGSTAIAGADLMMLSGDLGAQFGVREGLVVMRVGIGTPAARAELHPGDVIVRAGKDRVSRPADLQEAIRKSRNHTLHLRVVREHRVRTVQLRW